MKNHNTVVILGNYEGTRGLFDWSRKDCDIWVLNEMLSNTGPDKWVERADVVFQLHAEAIWRNPMNRTDPGHYDWLRTQLTHPVYMQKKYDDVPMSIEYPLEEIKTFLLAGFNIKNVFSSTLSYCMALAIHQGYDQIETYGVELGTETEYFHQREGFTFWVGYALGRGIRVRCETTQLLKAPLYGYEGEVTLPYETFVERVQVLAPVVAELEQKYLERRKMTAEALLAMKKEMNDETVNKVIECINFQNVAAVEYAIQEGGRQHNERFVEKADVMKAASGGEFIFSRQEFESARVSMKGKHAQMILQAQTHATRCSLLLDTITKRTNNKKKRAQLIDQLAGVIEEYVKHNVEAGMLAGGVAEASMYVNRLDAGIRAAGGSKSVEAVLAGAK